MAHVVHETGYDEPGYNSGWIIALVVAILVLLAVFFLWRAGYFGAAPTQINIQPPAQQAPQTPQAPQAPQAPQTPPSPQPGVPGVSPGAPSTTTT